MTSLEIQNTTYQSRFLRIHIFTVHLPVADGGGRCWSPLSQRETRRRRRAGGSTSKSTWRTSSREPLRSRRSSRPENRGENSRNRRGRKKRSARELRASRKIPVQRDRSVLPLLVLRSTATTRIGVPRERSGQGCTSLRRAREVFW